MPFLLLEATQYEKEAGNLRSLDGSFPLSAILPHRKLCLCQIKTYPPKPACTDLGRETTTLIFSFPLCADDRCNAVQLAFGRELLRTGRC